MSVHLELVSVRLGAYHLGIDIRHVQALHDQPPADDAPPCIALHTWLGLPPTPIDPSVPDAPRRYIHLRATPHSPVLVWEVPGPVELQTLPAACIHPLPPLVKSQCRLAGLQALALWQGRLVLLLGR